MVTLVLFLGESLFCGFFPIDLLTLVPQPWFLILPSPHTHSGGLSIHRCEGPHGDYHRKLSYDLVTNQLTVSGVHCCGTYEQQSRENKSLQSQQIRLRISVLRRRVFRGHKSRCAGNTDLHDRDGWSLNPGVKTWASQPDRPGLLLSSPTYLPCG